MGLTTTMPTDHSLIAQHSIRHRFPYSLQLCRCPSGKSGQLPFLSPFPKVLLARAQPCAEPLHCNGQQRTKLRTQELFSAGRCTERAWRGAGKTARPAKRRAGPRQPTVRGAEIAVLDKTAGSICKGERG